ncbi:MAG: hypothetical protein M3R50_12150 [Bacteroidota bacterium]|nr:hypothetical protein [Bacteroidota bacterium]
MKKNISIGSFDMISILLCIALFILFSSPVSSLDKGKAKDISTQKISIEWNSGKPSGTIEVLNGTLIKIEVIRGKGKIKDSRFNFTSAGQARISVEINNVKNQLGPEATIISVKTDNSPFSFFLRDVSEDFPIYIPGYSVVVLRDSDNRSYAEIQLNILSRKLKTKLQKIESEPEESFASAASRTMDQSVPTWLGISRDFRIFQIDESLPNMPLEANIITPKFSSSPEILPSLSKRSASYSYTVGRGVSVEINTVRRLDEGVLPILHSRHIDDDIEYNSTSFVSLEHSPLTQQTLRGTNYLVADNYSGGHMLTEEQEERVKPELAKTFETNEETVFYFKSEAINKGKTPHYAWFKTVRPGSEWWQKSRYTFDPASGFSAYSMDSVFCVSKLNGNPLPNEEIAVLIQPGETVTFEFYLPHSPISNERSLVLSKQSFNEKLVECRNFWQAKLKKAAQIHVPEKRIDEMLRAGLLHLDLITYGSEPNGTLAPTIGVYSPIGTESAPIIQFYNSMGWQDIAKRSLTYFLDKQHENGFMQNFGGYMVETGAVLWSMGEYYRYTHDKEWVKQIEPKILKSSDFLLRWRSENKIDSLKGKGYGMIAGKVADPEDPFHSFMLNGYAYLGLKRVAEMLSEIDPEQSGKISKEAEAWKKDIRSSFINSMASSPVVPLSDGTWSPTAPPWTEAIGPRSLFVKRETFYSHGTFVAHDDLLGPLYLVFCEVLDVNEPITKILLNYQSEMFYQNNAAFSQPYYSRYDWLEAKLHLVKPFLKTYYNTFSAMADRETYDFWEHLFHVSPHKTHEEAWFLMETRWMLYMEDGSTLRLLNTIPRKWMENGKTIELKNVQSYFGALTVKVQSEINKGYIDAVIECNSDRKPKRVTIRLPHPDGIKAVRVTGGEYDPNTETVTVKSFSGLANIRLEY